MKSRVRFPYRRLVPIGLVGKVMTFRCEMGHAFANNMQYPKGKRHPGRLDINTIQRLYNYWQPTEGQSWGALCGICPKCERTATK